MAARYLAPKVGNGGRVPWSIYRAMLKLDLSTIPNGAALSSARLQMHAYTFGGPLTQPNVQIAQPQAVGGTIDQTDAQSRRVLLQRR